VGGTSTIDGVSAYELSVGASADVLPPRSTAYVATSDYRPLVIDYNANGGQTISFEAYEYLPANAVNLSLLNLVAQHPGARMVGYATDAYIPGTGRTHRSRSFRRRVSCGDGRRERQRAPARAHIGAAGALMSAPLPCASSLLTRADSGAVARRERARSPRGA
jgi:hypothetical protein